MNDSLDDVTDRMLSQTARTLAYKARKHDADAPLSYYDFLDKCRRYLYSKSYSACPDKDITFVRSEPTTEGYTVLFLDTSGGNMIYVLMHWSETQHRVFVRRLIVEDSELTPEDLEV